MIEGVWEVKATARYVSEGILVPKCMINLMTTSKGKKN